MGEGYILTSESVTEGHPDKLCDQISDAILDALLTAEAKLGSAGNVYDVRCAVEALVSESTVVIAGEIRAHASVNIEQVVRDVLRHVGYTSADSGIDCNTCTVINLVHGQSADIARGVDAEDFLCIGAGDQGTVFGYATNETSALIPLPAYLASCMAKRLANVRKSGAISYLRPDGKTQVSVNYVNNMPTSVTAVVLSAQHAPNIPSIDAVRTDLFTQIIAPVLAAAGLPWHEATLHINPTGRFVVGGPVADTGLTGRKLMVDTYGGLGHHGGGAFSGKDATKVDRSGAYAARWVAKNVVAAGLAQRCEVQIAYAIGVAEPVALTLETFGTGVVSNAQLATIVSDVFDLRPGAIIRDLSLMQPIFTSTAAYGHFGRSDTSFTWENTNRIEELQAAASNYV